MQQTEIGGYFGLEDFAGREYYPDLIRLNLGRTALLYLMDALSCRRIFLPWYLCDSVTERCIASSHEVVFYHIDKNLRPLPDEQPGEQDYLYLVNYYGQLSDEQILNDKRLYKNIIVDHTHSFFQRPLPDIPTIYSCRKYFGLPDGAYLSADLPNAVPLETDRSADRMGHILGRFEQDASTYYQTMLDNAAVFHSEPVKAMSRLTRNLLKVIDYEKVRQQRNENYAWLSENLGAYNPLGFAAPDGPFTYPFYHPDAQRLRRELAKDKIYIPVYWSSVIQQMPEDSVEYDYAAHILPLPCDQRYQPEDLEKMVRLIKEKGLS